MIFEIRILIQILVRILMEEKIPVTHPDGRKNPTGIRILILMKEKKQ